MMEAQCAINGSRADTQRDYTACAVSSATCVSDMYAVTDVQGQAYRLITAHEGAKPTTIRGIYAQRNDRVQQVGEYMSDLHIVVRINIQLQQTSQFVYRLYILTNLLLDHKCSLVYQHMQLILVHATYTSMHTYCTSQLAKACCTMSYIFLYCMCVY